MAILLVKQSDNPGDADDPLRWRAGEMVIVREDTASFGWEEMPVRYMGSFTVAQINAQSLAANDLTDAFKAVTCTDAGIITNGTSTFDVEAGDVLAWQYSGFFVNYGPRTGAPQNFYAVFVTDKTADQAREHVAEWQHNPTVQQISATGNDRRIEVTSDMVSATGAGAFVLSDINDLIADLSDYSGAYVSHTDNSFQFDITAEVSDRDDIVAHIEATVRGWRTARRHWYINAAGMTYLSNNDGMVKGTAAAVSVYLKNALLE